jgi:cell division protein ZapA (FtsZ GTPase activity inhibitor)
MPGFAPTALAVLAALLILAALVAMSARNLQIAGLSFLSASLVIYLRKTRYLDD